MKILNLSESLRSVTENWVLESEHNKLWLWTADENEYKSKKQALISRGWQEERDRMFVFYL